MLFPWPFGPFKKKKGGEAGCQGRLRSVTSLKGRLFKLDLHGPGDCGTRSVPSGMGSDPQGTGVDEDGSWG